MLSAKIFTPLIFRTNFDHYFSEFILIHVLNDFYLKTVKRSDSVSDSYVFFSKKINNKN